MLELVQIFIDNIAPILLIATAGVWLRRVFNVQPEAFGSLIFNLLSPALVFRSLYANRLSGGEFLALFVGTVLLQIALAAITWVIMRGSGANPVDRATMILGAFCLNAGNYGLALVGFAFGDEVLARAVVVTIANITMNYSLGVYIASNGRSSPREALMRVARTPAIYAVIAAFTILVLNIHLPLPVERVVNSLADASIPMMLILLGIQLGNWARSGKRGFVISGTAIKLLLAPLLGAGIALLLGMNQLSWTAFIIQAAMPTAVITIVFATEFKLNRDLSLNLILASTLLSPFTLSVLILLLR